MAKLKDITGMTFGQLTVLFKALSVGNGAEWTCRCSCGKTVKVNGCRLRNGQTRSCGCLRKDALLLTNIKRRMATDGRSKTREYHTWCGMKTRCYNETSDGYKNYGGRGITIDARWLESFDNFLADMGRAPTRRHTVGRIDNDGPYSPENCRWELPVQQSHNTRDRKGTATGVRGVYRIQNKPGYMASIGVGGKSKYLGYFLDLEEAKAARKEAEKKYWAE